MGSAVLNLTTDKYHSVTRRFWKWYADDCMTMRGASRFHFFGLRCKTQAHRASDQWATYEYDQLSVLEQLSPEIKRDQMDFGSQVTHWETKTPYGKFNPTMWWFSLVEDFWVNEKTGKLISREIDVSAMHEYFALRGLYKAFKRSRLRRWVMR